MIGVYLTRDQIDILLNLVYFELEPYVDDLLDLRDYDVEAVTDLGNLFKILSLALDRIDLEETL